jgi:uncharacterized membrane protein YphA (DoxX/SURF4 family)
MNDIRKSLEQAQTSIARWAPIPLRPIVGYGFMQHVFAKFSKGPEAFAAILHAIGVPAPHLMAWLAILTEFFGGLAVLLGALVPLVSLPMSAVLLVALHCQTVRAKVVRALLRTNNPCHRKANLA